MAKKSQENVAQNPLILRCHRLMEAFAKSDDERDFYLDRSEGFMIFVDLDKNAAEIEALELELASAPGRYCPIPKLTFYETKKIMEGFINEKVYDIDTKEKLLDIIQSKEARENFLEFIYDHHSELEKWQQYYQERSRIRIIEWLRQNELVFVFEEDLDLTKNVVEKLKRNVFETTVAKDVSTSRKLLATKAKTYYSNEALNPRPKRGRPPKQQAKVEVEPQVTLDCYQTVPKAMAPFIFSPDVSHASAVTFSARFDSTEDLLASLRGGGQTEHERTLNSLNQRLASLRRLSSKIMGEEKSAELRANLQPKTLVAQADPLLSDADQHSDIEAEIPAPTLKKKPLAARRRPTVVSDTDAEAKPRRGRPPKAKPAEANPDKPPAKRRIIPKKPTGESSK